MHPWFQQDQTVIENLLEMNRRHINYCEQEDDDCKLMPITSNMNVIPIYDLQVQNFENQSNKLSKVV